MQKNKPQVSVIISSFNRADVVGRAIQSLQAQTFANWEGLIIDDGSTDNTFNVVQPLIHGDSRLLYINQANQGLPGARNTGIRCARGEWLTFLDSDDAYKPEHLQTRLDFIAQNPTVEFIHGGYDVIGDENAWYVPDADDPTKRVHLSDCVVGGTFFGRAYVFWEFDGFDPTEKYAPDYRIFDQVNNTFEVASVDFPTYLYYRDREDSLCNTKDKKYNTEKE